MVTQSADTRPEAERVWFDLMRRASPSKKFSMVEDTTRMMRQTLMTGLRLRHAGASETVLRRLFAESWLGPDLAARAYGDGTAELPGRT